MNLAVDMQHAKLFANVEDYGVPIPIEQTVSLERSTPTDRPMLWLSAGDLDVECEGQHASRKHLGIREYDLGVAARISLRTLLLALLRIVGIRAHASVVLRRHDSHAITPGDSWTYARKPRASAEPRAAFARFAPSLLLYPSSRRLRA
jgi:hypothetical protein